MQAAPTHYPRVLTSSGIQTITVDGALIELTSDLEVNRNSLTLFAASWIALLSDSPITRSRKPLRLYVSFKKDLYSDVRGTVLRFSDLAHKLVSQHTLMGAGTSIGPWIDEFRNTPVFFEYHHYFQTGDQATIDFLYSFLVFGKKMEFECKEFFDTALRGWLDNEKALDDLKLSKSDPLIKSIGAIIREVLPFPSTAKFWPKHGPGQTAEKTGRSKHRKHTVMLFDALLDRFFFHGHIGKYGLGEDFGLTAEKVIPSVWTWAKKGLSRARLSAVLKFVPKNLKTARSICMEPARLMFFQQAVWRWMAESIECGPLHSFIKLSDQSYNRSLALAGSYTGEIDTIDLSSASDRLSFELVRMVFPPSWLIPMTVTRSKGVKLPNGDDYVINKFAPMGSALCFPTQCIIFASVCILAAHLDRISCSPSRLRQPMEVHDIHLAIASLTRPAMEGRNVRPYGWYSLERVVPHAGSPKGDYDEVCDMEGCSSFLDDEHVCSAISESRVYRPIVRTSLQPLAVYGDDIACDSRLTDSVKSILRHIGFAINDDKSFVANQSFRESCGGFYLEGFDITPVYYRVKGVGRRLSPSQIWSQVHLVNAARTKGFFRLSSFLQHSLFEWDSRYERISIPFVSDTSTEWGIIVKHPQNKHLRMVPARYEIPSSDDYSAHLQRDEYLVWAIVPASREEVTHASERYSLMRWFASRSDYDSDALMVSGHSSPANPRIQWRWTPLY